MNTLTEIIIGDQAFMYKQGENDIRGSPSHEVVYRQEGRAEYIEVWKGLPDLPFAQVRAQGGEIGLRHSSATVKRKDNPVLRNYIWIPPTTVLTAKNPDALLVAMGKVSPANTYNVWWVMPRENFVGILEEIRRIPGVERLLYNKSDLPVKVN